MMKRGSWSLWVVLGLLVILAMGVTTISHGQEDAVVAGEAAPQADLGTAFTYQGRLTDTDTGEPVAGPCDLRFGLYGSASGADLVGGPQTVPNVTPLNGYFSAELDFGAGRFTGESRYLKIEVDCGGGFVALAPRIRLRPAPNALALPGLWTQQNATSPNLIGGYSGNQVTAGVVGATVGGGGMDPWVNRVTDNYGTVGGGQDNRAGDNTTPVNGAGFATVGGGYANVAGGTETTVAGGAFNTASGRWAAVGGGRGNMASGQGAVVGGGGGFDSGLLLGNTANGNWSTVGGGGHNTASGLGAVVGGGGGIALEPTAVVVSNTASGAWSVVAGGRDNVAGEFTSAIGGGSYNEAAGVNSTIAGGSGNRSSGEGTTIGGGSENRAMDQFATVGGGNGNQARGLASNVDGGWWNVAAGHDSTVGGGRFNVAAGQNAVVGGGGGYDYGLHVIISNTAQADWSTVGGGRQNEASGESSTVGGGRQNVARAPGATVPGGQGNAAEGAYSFAAGLGSLAELDGCFVWSDSTTDSELACLQPNEFAARASGGVVFWSSSDLTSGVWLEPGTSAWQPLPGPSDRNLKAGIEAVDGRQVLGRLAEMPIATWYYKGGNPNTRHMGPMAQDFYAAFGLGQDDKHLSPMDTNGVALAAVQALYAENQALQQQVDDLEARLAALEAAVQGGPGRGVAVQAGPEGGSGQ